MKILLIVFGIIFSSVGVAAVARSILSHVKCVKSKDWKCVPGRITHSEDESGFDRDSSPLISYEYVVEGTNYVGSTIKFDHNNFSFQSTKAKLDAYPVGQEVNVFFDPGAQQNSVLEPGIESLAQLIYNHVFAAGILVLGTVILILGCTL